MRSFARHILDSTPRPIRYPLHRIFKRSPWTTEMIDGNWVFVHIPKCAGTSIWAALSAQPTWHPTLDEYFAHDAARARKAYKFTIVRNPWDRLVSSFHYMVQVDPNPEAARWLSTWFPQISSFDAFLHRARTEKSVANAMRRHHLFKPQIDFIKVDGRIAVDKWIKLEQIDEQIVDIFEQIGFDRANIPMINKSKHSDYVDYFRTTGDIKFVSDFYRSDVEAFDYQFGGLKKGMSVSQVEQE